MKFKFSLSPNYHHNVDTHKIMMDVVIALLFVSICSIILQYTIYGIEGSIRAALILFTAVATTTLVDFVFWKINKVSKEKMASKIQQNVPIITGLILGLTLPLGNLDSLAMFYVTFISAIIAELFGKLIYGGFGYNIFNPAAVGRAFALVAFSKYLAIPAIDGLSSATPLYALSKENGLTEVYNTFSSYSSLLFGTHAGAVGETMAIPIILAAIYMIYKHVIDWVIPVFAVGTIAVLSLVNVVFSAYPIDFIFIQVFSGGLIFAAVFMLTDPVTNPLNRQGKIIYAILFSLLTYLIRTKASLPEGVIFAILIMNMLVPSIDRFTANLTDVNTNKKVQSIAITMLVAIGITILFQFV